MLIFPVLICAVSLILHAPISLNIYNQSQIVNLSSPAYFTHGGRWHVIPNQEIDVNAVTRNRLEFNSGQDILKGVLVYRIQRKHAESDKSAQDESKHIWLLVAWYAKHTKGLHVRALLVEHDKELDWNEDGLMKLHQDCWQPLNVWVNPIESNWQLDDATVLATTIKAMNRGYGWDIFISEGKRDNVKKPLRMDAQR
jgi:hypothetical protein